MLFCKSIAYEQKQIFHKIVFQVENNIDQKVASLQGISYILAGIVSKSTENVKLLIFLCCYSSSPAAAVSGTYTLHFVTIPYSVLVSQRQCILIDGRAKMDNEGSEANWTQCVAS